MDATRNHYYNIVYKISSLTGAWPFLKPRIRVFRVILLTIAILTIFVPQVAYQFTCKKDLHCTFEASTSYLLTVVVTLKVYTFQFNISTIKNLTRHLFVDWKNIGSPEEYEIMKSYAQNSRRFCLIYSVYCSMAVFTFMSVSLIPFVLDMVSPLNQSRPVLPPYPGYYFVDIREYFLPIFWHSLVAWQILMTGIIAHDCMYVTYVEHICSMFAVIGCRFERLFHNCDEMEIVDMNDIHRKKVAFIVHTHRESLKFAELLEDIFNIPLAVQMLIVTVGMSITLLQISQQNSDLLETIKYVLYVIGQLIHLFFLSFEGQKLIDHSLQTRDKIYNSTWYDASVKSQKLSILVMMKCHRPSFLSAGKVYIFSLESFTALSMQFHNFAEATKYILFLGGQLFHLFCYSFEGQKLINHSSETCDKIYNGMYCDMKYPQRLHLMVIRKSVKASTLTAGKIYIFSLESFTTVLQTSMSYFTVLSSFNE